MHKGVTSPSPESNIIAARSLQIDRPLAETSLGLPFLMDRMKLETVSWAHPVVKF